MQRPDLDQFSQAEAIPPRPLHLHDTEDVPARSSGAWILPSVLVGTGCWIALLTAVF